MRTFSAGSFGSVSPTAARRGTARPTRLDRIGPSVRMGEEHSTGGRTMTSPFPGMDPYLEHPGYWRDFHQSFITYWRDWLADNLPDHYDVSIDERLGVVQEYGSGKAMLPDVSITQSEALPEEL